jgi:hypothetical protein
LQAVKDTLPHSRQEPRVASWYLWNLHARGVGLMRPRCFVALVNKMKRADYALLVQGREESESNHDKCSVCSQLRATYYL